jgi:hypothetical protein
MEMGPRLLEDTYSATQGGESAFFPQKRVEGIGALG